ncbi:hypothetical protein SAY87_012386 [Trapa incisa]|uniref:Fe2OG dioxygenase domain-containing protein n=1 Tax=Trapa incisa TaxID=236973 RepID=A0AAN7GQ71_9MYRT|nr:hypothetical protein SAY87_012386 [Trapa incisa]
MVAPSKILLADLAAEIDLVPPNYVRPVSDRPNMQEVETLAYASIPVIDLQGLHGHDHSKVIQQIGQACEEYGFFQVKNHEVAEELVGRMMEMAREFFWLPEEERLKNYSDDPTKTTRLSTSFNVRTEKVSNWRDFLRLHCYPLEQYLPEWPINPPSFREEVTQYCTSIRALVLRLLEGISESLGLERGTIAASLGRHGQHMALNYYPPCPQPELTYGLPGHTDPNLITILLQDDVPGLQVFNGRKWVAVNPIPNTFIVNIGDQMQVISNDKYKSVLHRAVVNCEKERISVPTFYCPSPDAVIGPAKELISDENPAVYRNFTYHEYYDRFWNRGLAKECCLDLFRK